MATKNGNYVPYDGAACYPLHTQDFIRTGFQDISYTLSARDYKDPKCVIVKGGTEMIDEVKELGFMDNGTGKHQSNTVVDENGLAPTEQRLEPNSQGICNTLTSVTKDNLVLEKNVAALRMVRTEVGKALRKQYENHEITHGFNEHRVAEPREDNCSNTLSTVQKDNMLLETVRIKQATKDGYIECKVGGVADLSFPDSTTRRGRVQDGGDVCPTLMAGEQDICRIEKKCISTKGKENDVASTILSGYERSNMTGFNADNGVLEQYYLSEKGKQYACDPKRGMCTDINADVCQTLTAKGQSNWTGSFVSPDIDRLEKSTNIGSEEPTLIHLKDGRTITSNDCLTQYRIRKLTPRECYRLMAVPEKDIDKMLEVNSNTQCYKQAGNSIVVNCLIAIFSQMGIQGIPRWNEGLSEKYK